ncbi:MAG: CsbD family protein [Opitutales bacterium]
MKTSTHNQAEGTVKIIVGDIKEAAGKLVGNPRLKSEGKAEQAEGQAQKKVGEIEKVLGR